MRKALPVVQTLISIAVVLAFAQGVTSNADTPGKTPNASDTVKDPRLGQKITYQVKLRPIAEMTDDLTKATGIAFRAGRTSSDWRVREDCITIIAKDIPLSSLMNSIARAMKFRWVRRGTAPNWTYRLVEDTDAIARVKRRVAEQERRHARERQARWDKLIEVSGMSPQQLEKIKEDEPRLYLYAKSGTLTPLIEFLNGAPAVTEAWQAGEELKLSASWLPPNAQEAMKKAARAQLLAQSRMTNDISEQDWITSVITELDGNSREITVCVHKSSFLSPIAGLSISGHNLHTGFSFRAAGSRSGQMGDKALLKAYEEKIPYIEVLRAMREQIRATVKQEEPKVRVTSYTQEPLLEHPADPAMSEPLKQKVESKVITGLVASLADAGGYAVVTDDFRGISRQSFDQGTELGKALDAISTRYRCNWNRKGQVIEIWDLNWYDKREARLSKAWLDALRRKFKEAGTLDIDDLAQIASLTDAQLSKNISRDSVLKWAARPVWDKRDYLKLCSSLTRPQRSMLLSGPGLAYADLSPEQQDSTLRLICGQSVPFLQDLDMGAIGARITCVKETQGKQFVYTLKAYTHLGEIPGQYRFRTPTYIEPPKAGSND
ncbi:MAG: hypothetical protein Q7T82_18495 [Armatimonadota bacterium]|nr:hypothetical protein [Armatimonadota bacterium]